MSVRKNALLLGATSALLILSGCASPGSPRHGDEGVSVDYDGFYDGHYGVIYDGYWGADDTFYYSDARGHAFRPDGAHHVRHESAGGFHAIHGVHEAATDG